MPRFIALALPAFFLVLALAGLAGDLGGAPPLAASGKIAGLWALETLGVVGIYSLVRSVRARAPSLWDGVLVAWGAWIFRGPLLVLAVAATPAAVAPAAWRSSVVLLGAYSAGGAVLAAIDRWLCRRGDLARGVSSTASST